MRIDGDRETEQQADDGDAHRSMSCNEESHAGILLLARRPALELLGPQTRTRGLNPVFVVCIGARAASSRGDVGGFFAEYDELASDPLNAFNQQLTRHVAVGGGVGTTTAFAYDDNGNTLSETAGTAVTSYTWDRDNRLRTVTPPAPGVPTQYSYDAKGLRVQRVEATGTTRYLLDGSNVLAELDGTNATTTRYLNNPQAIDDVIGFERGGAMYWLLTDALGSIYAVTDSGGAVVRRYDFDVYGVRTDLGGTGPTLERGYTSRYLDPNGIQENRDRQRRPELGGWLQADRIGQRAGPNVYSYGSPTRTIDPMGTFPAGVSIGQSVYNSPYAREILNEVPIAIMAAMDFEMRQESIAVQYWGPFPVVTLSPLHPVWIDIYWRDIGFVPLVRLEVAACGGARGETPYAASYWAPIIYIDPTAWPRAGPFKYAPTIVHEWVHASINDLVSARSPALNDGTAADPFDFFFNSVASNHATELMGMGTMNVSEVIAHTVTGTLFPPIRSPP